ncbi:multimerin-1-like isoform X2 [Stegostoma tigrinum]|uniref:multimerin-1-like isoform X2 n=1 Tax=Stegostoma tigrinum TaxID=3053191 RepID=UPI0028706AD7|nr:multimerin-1-like isoform X2 [Stegostoma tigrinum]
MDYAQRRSYIFNFARMWSLIVLGIAFPLSAVCNGGLDAKSPDGSAMFGLTKNESSFSTAEVERNRLGKLIDRSASSNRFLRQVDYHAGKGVYKSSSRQKHPFFTQSGSSHPNFETARGKNWCAHVHTRLSPTMTIQNEQTYVMPKTNLCPMKLGHCQQRYQILNRPTYRMRHKIVTSLEWKCCPGYTGATCQPKDQHLRRQAEENQAESQITGAGVSQDPQQPLDPALTAKFNDKLYNQEIKLSLLRKKVENMSANMNDVRSVLYSLEGKLNEDQGKDLQSTSKATKSKGFQELVKDLVTQQIRLFQDNTQEMVTQLYKTISGLTEELQSTKDAINQLNSTILSLSENSQSKTLRQNYTSVLEIQEIRKEMEMHRTDVTVACNGTSQELNEKFKSLQAELEKTNFRIDTFYENMNHTFSQVRETQERLNSNHIFPDATISEEEGGQMEESFQKNLLNITKKIKVQGHMISQLYAEVNVHRLQLFNLTYLVSSQQEVVNGTCQEMVEECKSNTDQLNKMENKLYNLNKTFTDTFTLLEDFLASLNERISILSYDVEILQSVNERHVPLDETGPAGYGSAAADHGDPVHGAASRAFAARDVAVHGSEVAVLVERLNNLSFTVNSLVATIKGAGDDSPIGNQNQAGDESLTSFLAECRFEIEDSLNDTMIIINDAVDSMRDSYYILENNVTQLRRYVLELYHKNVEKQTDALSVVPQLTELNASFMAMLDDLLRHQYALEMIGSLEDMKENEMNVLPNLIMMSQLLNKTVATTEVHQQMIRRLEEAVLHSPSEARDYESRILALETQMSSLMGRSKSSTKVKTPKITKGEFQLAPPKYQVLSRKVTGLQSKWINLNKRLSQMEEVTGKTWGLCQNLSLLVTQVNASFSQAALPVVKPNITDLQEDLRDFMQSISEATVGMYFTNMTVYMDRAISNIVRNFTKIQKQIKQLYKRPRIINKANITTNAGRSQRYADKGTFPESTSCTSRPCQNGGTCINQRKGFVCACRPPFGGPSCDEKLLNENALKTDFSKGSYRYAPMVTFFVAHTYEMKKPGPIKFNHLYVNYGAGYAPGSGKFLIPYLGVYVFEYSIETSSSNLSGYLVVDGVDKLAFQSKDMNSDGSASRVVTGDAMLELNYGQRVWLRLTSGSIPAKFPPMTTFGGYLLYRT